MLRKVLIPNSLVISLKTCEKNCGPLSDRKESGRPNCQYTYNEIASDLGKWGSVLLGFDWNEARGGCVCVDFYLLTNGTACDIVPDEDCHPWPPIMTSYEF